MDPNVTLTELREFIERVQNGTGRVDEEEFAEKFAALDGWISRGGFLPTDWSEARHG